MGLFAASAALAERKKAHVSELVLGLLQTKELLYYALQLCHTIIILAITSLVDCPTGRVITCFLLPWIFQQISKSGQLQLDSDLSVVAVFLTSSLRDSDLAVNYPTVNLRLS